MGDEMREKKDRGGGNQDRREGDEISDLRIDMEGYDITDVHRRSS
jgi:hypothetical protein